MTTVQPTGRQIWRWATTGIISALLLGLFSACGSTEFINEGPGQPPDRSFASVPAGSIGVCKLPHSKRPPIVDETIWAHADRCRKDTPYRILRLGYGKVNGGPEEDLRMKAMMRTLKQSAAEANGNTKMLQMIRTVRQQGKDDPRLAARIERASGRTFSCDYHYMLRTTARGQHTESGQTICPALAWDPVQRKQICLFEVRNREAMWLTSSWGCVAFTGTLGEGESCYRQCQYDDYCASQVSCAAPDLDLLLCALGVCLPEKAAAGIY